MKNSTKILIIIISIIVILPIVIAFHCRHRVQTGDYDQKFVVRQMSIIPNIHILELEGIPANKLIVFADGSSRDTLCYSHENNWWMYGFSNQDSIPYFSSQNEILKVENKFRFTKDTSFINKIANDISYSFGVKNLNKILVKQSQLYFYNSSKDGSPNINIEISDNGQCIVGEIKEMWILSDLNKAIPDSNILRTYKNMDIKLSNGVFEIKDYTNIDTLRIHAADEKARILLGSHIKFKHIEGELKSMSIVKGDFENMDLFKAILIP